MMYICFLLSSFGALYSGQTFCIYMGCTDIGYCVYGICGSWILFMVMYMGMFMDVFMDRYLQACISGCVYGYVFMVMCIWVCLGYVSGYVFGYVFGYVYGYRVSILRKARFNKCRGLPLLGARFGDFWGLLLHEAHFSNPWDLLRREAHFIIIGSYSFTRPIWITLRIFPIFPDINGKICPSM